MNDLKFDILHAPKVVQSELDIAMQPYINFEPPYSKEELAKIRRRLSNQIKENKAAEEKRLKAAKEGPAEGSQVKAFNKVIDEEKPKVKKDDIAKTVTKDIATDIVLNSATGGLYKPIKNYFSKQEEEKRKNLIELEKKHEDLGTKKKLMNQFGTSDRVKIIGDHYTNEDGSLKSLAKELVRFDQRERDDKTYLNPNDLPMFDDEDIMEYLYAPYMEDYENIATRARDWAFGLFGVGDDYVTPENERQKRVFQNRFSSSNTDRSDIIDYITAKQSNYRTVYH